MNWHNLIYLSERKLVSNIIVYVIFTLLYKMNSAMFNKKNISNTDILYFSTITHSTVGYGDIAPITNYGKLLCSLHIIIVFLINTGL